MSKLIIMSSLGLTDCSGCKMVREGTMVFAEHVPEPGNYTTSKFVSLPIKIAEMPSAAAAERALWRITYAIETEKRIESDMITVDLRDLEGN